MKREKKKLPWQQLLAMGIFMLVGAVCGVMAVDCIRQLLPESRSAAAFLLVLLGLFAAVYGAVLLQTVIHEAGHLVFGLLSGYRFSSFRILSLMWLKEEGKIRFRRLSIPGTAGQCLMTPPEPVNGAIPVKLFNLGGSLMNLLASAVFLALYAVTKAVPLLSAFCAVMTVTGVGLALVNGIPLRLGTIDNDGYNAFSLGKSRSALRGFWLQLKVNDQIARNVRLKEMPEEWFTVPEDWELENSMVCSCAVLACNRLMDEHRFSEADRLMKHLLSVNSGIVGLHRSLLICDRIFCGLIGEGSGGISAELYTPEQKKFMKSMKNFPTVIRTEYALALLSEKDTAKSEKLCTRFEKIAKSYPYPSDICSERELMAIAAEKAKETQS